MANEIYTHYTIGSTLYAILRNRAMQVWNPQAAEFEEWGSGGRGISDYAVAMTSKSGGIYACDMPGEVPIGEYIVTILKQAGELPAQDDDVVISSLLCWSGNAIITAEKMLACRADQDKISGEITYFDYDGQTAILKLQPVEDTGSIKRMPI